MISSFRNIFAIPELRKKLLFTFGALIVYRIGFFITLPGISREAVETMLQRAGGSGVFALLNFAGTITGGALANCVLFALGIMPYISAAIIFQLLVKVVPSLEALQKEGASGRQKITQYTRYTTVLLCLVQAIFILVLVTGGGGGSEPIVEETLRDSWLFWVQTVVALVTGGIFLMWLGEQITEFGIGNGISLLIMAGIIAAMPGALSQFYTDIVLAATEAGPAELTQQVLKLVSLFLLFVGVVVCVVIMQQSQRRIPIQQAKHTRGRRVYGGQRTYLPLRVNSAGVMPVIFAQSLLILPAVILSYIPGMEDLGNSFTGQQGFWFVLLTIIFVGFFTYFWVSLTFNPVELADNMKESGSFIPGIRPGKRTAEYLEGILNRLTFVSAAFLAAITIFPIIVSWALGITQYITSFLGGTGILIVVGVALDLVQKIENHLLMRHYEGFMKKGKIRGRL